MSTQIPLDQQHLAPSAQQDEEEGMTLMEHLMELRQRLIYIGIAIIIGMGVGVFLVLGPPQLVSYIVVTVTGRDGSNGPPTQGLTSTEVFTSYMVVALTVGVILAMPMIVYQIIAFISPGLLPHEKRYLYRALPFVTLFFLAGVAFSWYIIVPTAVQFRVVRGCRVDRSQGRVRAQQGLGRRDHLDDRAGLRADRSGWSARPADAGDARGVSEVVRLAMAS